MIRQMNNPVSNTIEMLADNIDISFRTEVSMDGVCERIVVTMQDRNTKKIACDEYTGEEANLVFRMLAKPAMRLGEKLWK